MNPRQEMIREITEKYHLNSPGVFFAMLQVSREEFILRKFRNLAYKDQPISIGYEQTISQPYTVAFMTDLLLTSAALVKDKVLEIGTGSGYQAAILSFFFKKVYTVERIKPLYEKAKETLKRLGYKNVYCKLGQGEIGWKEKSPYDTIIITAGVIKVPKELFDQLRLGGVLVAPVGKGMDKVMIRYTKKSKSKFTKEEFGVFNFVPLIKNT